MFRGRNISLFKYELQELINWDILTTQFNCMSSV